MTAGAVLVPLADRLAAMQRTRTLLALAVAAAAAGLGDVLGDPSLPLVPISAGYVLVSSGVEGVRRLSGRRGLPVLSSSLVLDGAYLAVAVSSTGGADSPLLFLVHLHVVAAVLLLSFGSGALVSGWHAALLAVAHHLGLVPDVLLDQLPHHHPARHLRFPRPHRVGNPHAAQRDIHGCAGGLGRGGVLPGARRGGVVRGGRCRVLGLRVAQRA